MGRQLKVGLFVLFGLALTMLAIFIIGSSRRLWEPRVAYRTAFQDVAGLKPGAPVRMGGLDIGEVKAVGHDVDTQDSRIFVDLSVVKKEAGRIRTDTIARVAGKGLLGDKMVELTVGSPTLERVPEGGLLQSEEPSDVFAAANRVAAAAVKAVDKIEPLAESLGDPRFAEDIRGSAADVHSMLDAIVHGDGAMHRLFYDPAEGQQISEALAHLNQTSARLDATLADVQALTSQVREGPGIAHALVYDGDMSKNASGTLDELHQDLRAVREGNGLAHALLYGDDPSQHVMSNLNAMSDDLRAIVGNLKQGKGTLGALLVDPTVYEDIKSAVGNVERNEVLRALVRYSIKADEKRPSAEAHP
ncbi:MAG TPA: MlaD family protein [Polyangiaceae bacterium]|jgi:phospholipid/cholesterol/gamma-HCH transport system substrate-binding protein